MVFIKFSYYSTCKLCGKVIPGYHSGNLARHIERRHPEVATDMAIKSDRVQVQCDNGEEEQDEVQIIQIPIKTELSEDEPEEVITDYLEVKSTEPRPPKRPRMGVKNLNINPWPVAVAPKPSPASSYDGSAILPITADDLLHNYINIVVGDGLRVNFMNGLASSRLFSMINNAVGLAPVEPEWLIHMILERGRAEKNALIEELRGKGISLIIDFNSSCKSNCSVLAQFFNNGAIVRKFLGNFTIHTLEEDLERIREIVKSFELPDSCIYTVMSTDHDLENLNLGFSLPCLADMFMKSVIDTLPWWQKILDKVGMKNVGTYCSFDTICEKLAASEKRLKTLKAQQKLNSEEVQTVEEIVYWMKRACSVFEKINSDTSTVVTDVVAVVLKFWIQLDKQTGEVPKTFAKDVKTKFCQEVSRHDPINAAIFLDPRIQQFLSPAEKSAARAFLKKVYLQLHGGQDEEGEGKDCVMIIEEDDRMKRMTGNEDSEDEDDLTVFLMNKTHSEQSEVQSSKIERLLQDFTDVPLVSAKTDLFAYWESPDRDATLKTLALVVHAIPAVVRNYMDPSYILQVRSNDVVHTSDLQEAILFIGGNLRLSNEL